MPARPLTAIDGEIAETTESDLVAPVPFAATVEGLEPDAVLLRVAGRAVRARRAASLLLEPCAGDRVLGARDGDAHYVLAVLERRSGERQRLRLGGDAVLQVDRGSLALEADRGVEIRTPGDVTVAAGRGIVATASSTRWVSSTFAYVGRTATATLDTWSVVADRLETVARSLLQRLSFSVREVEGPDHLRCTDLDHRASGTASLRGNHTLVSARELVKVDAGQIHLG